MTIKVSPIAIAVALFLPSALCRMQCSMQTFKANIEHVQLQSATGLGANDAFPGTWDQASVTLTPQYYDHIDEAENFVKFTHFGFECSMAIASKQGPVCEGKKLPTLKGTDCAQVLHQYNKDSKIQSVAASVPRDEPVSFCATLTPSLQHWSAEVPDSCANQKFDAPTEGMKVITFSAHVPTEWDKVIIKLDKPDYNFTKGYLCAYDEGTNYDHPVAKTEDGITWEISGIGFFAKDPEKHYHD